MTQSGRKKITLPEAWHYLPCLAVDFFSLFQISHSILFLCLFVCSLAGTWMRICWSSWVRRCSRPRRALSAAAAAAAASSSTCTATLWCAAVGPRGSKRFRSEEEFWPLIRRPSANINHSTISLSAHRICCTSHARVRVAIQDKIRAKQQQQQQRQFS